MQILAFTKVTIKLLSIPPCNGTQREQKQHKHWRNKKQATDLLPVKEERSVACYFVFFEAPVFKHTSS